MECCEISGISTILGVYGGMMPDISNTAIPRKCISCGNEGPPGGCFYYFGSKPWCVICTLTKRSDKKTKTWEEWYSRELELGDDLFF